MNAQAVRFAVACTLCLGVLVGATTPQAANVTWQARIDQAHQARGQRNWEAADAALQQAVDSAPSQALTTRTFETWSTSYLVRGRKDKAAEIMEQLVEMHRSGSDPESIATVNALYRVGTLRRQVGPFAAAEAAFREALELRERIGGEQRPTLSTLLESVASMVARSDPRSAEREQLLLRNLEVEETADNHRALADAYRAAGDHEQALQHYTEALELEEGRGHLDADRLASYMGSIAREQRALGRPDDAEWFYLQALGAREDLLGADHPRLAGSLSQIGRFYLEQERHVESVAYLERALEIEMAAWGEDSHPCNGNLADALAQAYDAMHLPRRPAPSAAPEATFARAGESPAAVDPEDPRIEAIRRLDGQEARLRRQGEFAHASETARQALQLRREVHGEISLEVADGLTRLGRLLRQQSLPEEAIATFEEAIGVVDQMTHPDPRRLAKIVEAMGSPLRILGRDAEADVYFRRELDLRDALGHNLRAAHLEELLASIGRSQGRHEESAAFYRAAAERWRRIGGDQAPEILRIRAAAAALDLEVGNVEAAEAALLELVREVDARDYLQPSVAFQVLNPLRDLYRQTGRQDDLKALQGRLVELREAMRSD